MKRSLAPVIYKLEEYEPNGMNGIIIYCADLHIEPTEGGVYVEDIFFPDQPSETDLIPNAFIKALIMSIHTDPKLMEKLYDAARERFEQTFDGYR